MLSSQRTNNFFQSSLSYHYVDDIYHLVAKETEAWLDAVVPCEFSANSVAVPSVVESEKASDYETEEEFFYHQSIKKVERCLALTPETFLNPEILTEEEHLAIANSQEMLRETFDEESDYETKICDSIYDSVYDSTDSQEDDKYCIFQQRLRQALSEEELTSETDNSIRIPRNIVIASPTQNGKTQQVIDIIKKSYPFTLTVVSCDNKSDQMEQFFSRLKSQYDGDIFQLSGPIKALQLKKIIKSYNTETSNKRIVLILLNNSSQCKKLRNSIHTILNTVGIDIVKYQLIHDEADLVNKSGKAEFNGEVPVAAVHTEWLSHLHDLKNYPKIKQIKRIWVSATPENCSLIKHVQAKDILVLPKSEDYRSKIKFTEWAGDSTAVIKEVERINKAKSREAILYCTETTNAGQESAAKRLSGIARCPVIVYNGEGIVVRLPLRAPEKQKKTLPEVMESLSVSHPGAVIIVGHALMNRGISFVGSSESSEFPVTATVMFYNGSKTIHTVGIAQRIGRITGKSRPDIVERRLYTQRDIYESYCKYLKNQNNIYDFLESPENAELLVADILKTKVIPNLEIIKRPIDRKEVMEAFKPYQTACITSRSPNNSGDTLANPGIILDQEVEKMKRLVKSWIKPGTTSDISKIFKKIYGSPGHRLPSAEVKKMVEDLGLNESFYRNLATPAHSNRWCLVFSKDSQFHYIKPEAVEFANSLTKN